MTELWPRKRMATRCVFLVSHDVENVIYIRASKSLSEEEGDETANPGRLGPLGGACAKELNALLMRGLR